jgi:hypothetical protein
VLASTAKAEKLHLCNHQALTGHAVSIRKLFLAAKDVFHLLLFHGGLLLSTVLQQMLIGTCPALESVDAEGILSGWLAA